MPNGKPGDHPFTDIVIHGRDVYSPRAANLVREIVKLCDDKGRRELADLLFFEYDELANPDVKKLEAVLTEMRDRAVKEAGERGFEA
jgi:S-adenosylmethionine hydrolase